MKVIFFIPKFQNITNSFLFSYFSKIYEKAKNTANGKILVNNFWEIKNGIVESKF